MLRFAFSMLIATVAVALLASAVINGKLRVPLPSLRPTSVATAQIPQVTPAPEPMPTPVSTDSNPTNDNFDTIEIAPDRGGNYETDIEIRGRTIHVMVDTGATYFSLTADDADRLGIYPEPADFKYRSSTANGFAFSAKVRLDKVWIGNFEIDEVDAFVSQPGALQISLLGMNVLRRLGSVHISDGRLVLQR